MTSPSNLRSLVAFAALASAAAALAVACSSPTASSTTGGTGGGSVSSIDATKVASSLSDSEKTQYCKDSMAYLSNAQSPDDAKKATCLGKAVAAGFTGNGTTPSNTAARAACKAAYDKCLSEPAATTPAIDAGAPNDPCASAASDLAGCAATVEEMNACMQDSLTAMKKAYAAFDTYCDTLSLDGGASGLASGEGKTAPASCTALYAKCPKLGGGSASSGQ